MLPRGVAAGHPATVAAGIEILEDGGTAGRRRGRGLPRLLRRRDGDDRAARRRPRDPLRRRRGVEPRLLRRRPSGRARACRAEGAVRRGARPLRGRGGHMRRPGAAAGLDALWTTLRPAALAAARRAGAAARAQRRDDASRPRRLPRRCWRRCSRCNWTGSASTRRTGGHWTPARRSTSRASPRRSSWSQARAPTASIAARSRALLTDVEGVPVARADLERYEARWGHPVEAPSAGPRPDPNRALGRRGDARRLQPLPVSTRPSACTRCSRPSRVPELDGHTTNLVAADAEGSACVPDLEPRARHRRLPPRPRRAAEQHARRGRPAPRPLGRGANGEHDGSDVRARRRGAHSRSARPVGHGCALRSSASRPGSSTRARAGRGGRAAALPPRRRRRQRGAGVDERALGELSGGGLQVRRWPGLHHYFGGVSLIASPESCGDPRRSGHARRCRERRWMGSQPT